MMGNKDTRAIQRLHNLYTSQRIPEMGDVIAEDYDGRQYRVISAPSPESNEIKLCSLSVNPCGPIFETLTHNYLGRYYYLYRVDKGTLARFPYLEKRGGDAYVYFLRNPDVYVCLSTLPGGVTRSARVVIQGRYNVEPPGMSLGCTAELVAALTDARSLGIRWEQVEISLEDIVQMTDKKASGKA